MKKHSFAMVFLLIFTLSLVGAVSAGDNVTYCGDAPLLESQGEIQMEVSEIGEYENIDSHYSIEEESASVCAEEIQPKPVDCDYELGCDMTEDFTNPLSNDDCDNVLAIANAGFSKINNQTTENVLNEMINASNGYITYDKGNLLTLPLKDESIQITFVKNDEYVTIAFYNESTAPLYYGDACPEMFVSILENLMLNSEDMSSYLTGTDSRTNGLLGNSDFNISQGYVNFGLLGMQDTIQNFDYYPHEFDLPPVDTLGVSGDFDDDAFVLTSSDVQDEKASLEVSGVDKSMKKSSNLNLFEIGVNATVKALEYFKSRGFDFPKDYLYLYVFTSAGHVKINGLKTDEVLDGILEGLGPKFDETHLKSVEKSSWKNLVFHFVVVKNAKYLSHTLKYNSKNGKFIESSQAKSFGKNMGVKHLKVPDNYAKNDSNQTDSVNITGNRNSTDNSSDNKNESGKHIEIPVKRNANPFNIVYNLIAVLIVCVIFGLGYRKR